MRLPLLLIIIFSLFVQSDGFLGMFRLGRARRRRARRAKAHLNIANVSNITNTYTTIHNRTNVRDL